jgi:hypothetical protein
MIINRVNRDLAEKVYISVKNVEGATITLGLPVSVKPTAASMDGVSAVIANAAGDYPGFVGIATKNIANNDYGLVQISGYVNSVLISNVGSSITINAGDPLVPGPAGFFSAAPTYANGGFRWVQAGSDVPAAVSAAAYVTGVIRML